MVHLLDAILQESLRFEYQSGGIARLEHPHSTTWRTLPGLMCSQAQRGREIIHLAGDVRHEARTGEMILLAAGTLHKVDVVAPREVRRWCHVNYFILSSLDLFSLVKAPVLVGRKVGKAVGDLIQEWLEQDSKLRHDPLLLNAQRNQFGFRLLGLLAQVCRLNPDARERFESARQLRPVIQHMHSHFDSKLGRDDLAERAFLSPAQFHCVFKQMTGSAPMEYLRRIRIRHAQQLLITTSQSVSEIAGHCGYDDQFVFSKLFKRVCGLSPREYRQRTEELRAGPA
jgi:AraC-like DNA-binding protein